MNSILKKTLLAAAVATAASANAANIIGFGGNDSTFTDEEWPLVSSEGLAIQGTIDIGTGASDITVGIELEADYQETDLLIVTITGATIKSATGASVGGMNDFELIGQDLTAGTLTFRPVLETGVDAGTYDLAGITLEAFNGAVSVSSKGVTVQGIDIDQGASTPVALSASEFSIKADDTLSATIDVEKERKEFTNGTTDSFSVDVATGADLLAVTAGVASLAVTGSNLEFLNDKDGELDSDSYELDGLTEDTAKTELEGNTLTVVSTGAFTTDFGITFTADGEADADAQPLEAQSFSADVELTYSLGGTNGAAPASATLAAGAWGLSGAQINTPYLPWGPGITQIIYVSNDGAVDGDIELTGFDDEGNKFGPVMLSVSAAPYSVTKLSESVTQALVDEGFDGNGKVDFTLVINSPDADVELYSAYNVRGDRVTVPVIKM